MPAQTRKPKKFRVLFVNDEKGVHTYERKIAKKLCLQPKFAFNPEHAKRIIALRRAAIERLIAKKTKQLSSTGKEHKAILARQLGFLEKMRKNPFDLVVSDINMPRGNQTGIRLLRELQKEIPFQKLLVHSDDEGVMLFLLTWRGIPNSPKYYSSPALNDSQLAQRIREQLLKRK